MDFHPGHPPPTPPSLAFKFEPRRNFASNRAYHFAMSQHARAELLQLTKSSGAPIVSPHNDGRLEMWRMDSQQSYHRISDLSPFNYDLTESHSRANSSGHHSTPSDYYDEDAENIDPNSLQRKDHQTHHPLSVHSRPTNILCDSQAYPVASNIDLPQSQRVDTDPIAAPVPLPYSARSKEVLSAMISPVQPSGFPKPVSQEPSSSENLVAYTQSAYILPASETITKFSSNARRGLHYNYSREMAQYTVANTYTASRKHIRPISPATLLALTEPFLMAWIDEYPMQPLPSLPTIYADAQGC